MTDNEIIKALECCLGDNPPCISCKYDADTTTVDECMGKLMKDALDLINRQKAEKEALIAGQETLQKALAKQKAEIEELESEIDKQYKQAEADILGNLPQGGASCHWCIDKHKSYAIKEFAERLKDMSEHFDLEKENFVSEEAIDNLVKEMVGE